MKCTKCGYDDNGSGDMAHVCQRPSYRYGEHPTSFGLVPEQEPVAWQLKPHQPPEEGEFIEITARWGKRFVEMPDPIIGGNSLVRFYFDPPQRTWVGLTDIDYAGLPLEQVGLVRWAEAKLKEKNT